MSEFIENPTTKDRAEFVAEHPDMKIVDVIKDGIIVKTWALDFDEILYRGKPKKDPDFATRQLVEAKATRTAENESKRDVKYIKTSKGYLKTETPLGDLKMALGLFDKIVAANNGLPANSVRLYNDTGEIYGNEALTLAEYHQLVAEIAFVYLQIDAQSTRITEAIINAEDLETLNSIVIDYSNIAGELNAD